MKLYDNINDLLDWIDDGLLSLHNSHNTEGNTLEWLIILLNF